MIIGIDGSRAFVSQPTGTENYSYHMLRALAKVDRKNQYRIYIRSQNSEFRIQNFPKNFTLVPLNWPRLFTQAGLALHTWTDQLDLLWVPAHTLPILGSPRLPLLVTIHGVEFEHLPGAYRFGQNLHLTWSTRWAVHRASKIIAVSEKTKQDLINWLHVDPDKIKVIYEGVDLKKFHTTTPVIARSGPRIARRTTKQSRSGADLSFNRIATSRASRNPRNDVMKKYSLKKPYILFVGTIQPRKNLIRLIEGFSRLVTPGRWNTNLHTNKDSSSQVLPGINVSRLQLALAGKPGWDYQEILDAPNKFKVGDRVKFLGYISDQDLPPLYQNAALYVEPSLQEGFGLPILEAMASGIPVVAANAGALPEVAGDAAILINPLEISVITQGLAIGLGILPPKNSKGLKIPSGTSKLTPAEFRDELIKSGYQQTTKFSWQTAAKKLVKLFKTTAQPS